MATRPVTVNDMLDGHVVLDLESFDRVYLNGYVPNLQVGGQVVDFLTRRGFPIPSLGPAGGRGSIPGGGGPGQRPSTAAHGSPAAARSRPDQPAAGLQAWLAASAILMNSLVTIAGWGLWKAGVIDLDTMVTARIGADFLALLLLMDMLMYAGHTLAHRPAVFPQAHALHHRFIDARPATLYALHPLEVLGFGGLWLAALTVHAFSVWAVLGYTAVNLVFGIFGHLGVEVLPGTARHSPVFRWIATPTLHAGHHLQPAYT